MTTTKISKPAHSITGLYPYVAAPADYDADSITHEDTQHDSQIQVLRDIEAVLGLLVDDEVQAILDDADVPASLRGLLEEGADLSGVSEEVDAITYTRQRWHLASAGGWLVDEDGCTTYVQPWTRRQVDELIEGAVSTGAVVLDEPTHDDLVAYLTGE